jgi:alpha-N-acetylglucosamine transferase
MRRILYLLTSVTLAYLVLWGPLSPWRSSLREPDLEYGRLRQITAEPQYAIATFLTENTYQKQVPEDYYFAATRILTYQILHDPSTKCARAEIPFLVLVTDDVSQQKRERLKRDGAQVVPVEDIPLNWWIRTGVTRWKDQFTKLRLLEMTQYDRVLFIDADTILTRPVDGIFEDMQTPSSSLLLDRPDQVRGDEQQPPAQYVFGARSDNALVGERNHTVPPPPTEVFSAGFWMAAPSPELFDYLLSVMGHYRRFDPTTMEQSLLNYAFRRDGTMPWQELDYRWSATWPSSKDLEGGVASLHEKLWMTGPDELRGLWWSLKERMEEFHG